MICSSEGTQALFTGLATQIVYDGCDHDTADFYSKRPVQQLPMPLGSIASEFLRKMGDGQPG